MIHNTEILAIETRLNRINTYDISDIYWALRSGGCIKLTNFKLTLYGLKFIRMI